jgi:hypothetical protein
MAEENSIKINPTKPTEYEFDVMIQGIDVIGSVCYHWGRV